LPFVGGFPTLLWIGILCDQHKEKQTHTKLKTQKNEIKKKIHIVLQTKGFNTKDATYQWSNIRSSTGQLGP